MPEITITSQRLSEILDISVQYLRELSRDGVIVKISQNKYDLIKSIQGYLKYKNSGTGNTTDGISAVELGEIFGLSEKSIRDMANKKIAVRLAYGVYDPIESCKNYIEMLKVGKENEGESEKVMLQKTKRRAAELELMEKEGQLHNADDIRDFISEMLVAFKQEVLSIPSSLSEILANETDVNRIRAILTEHQNKTLRNLSEYPEVLDNGS